MNSAVDALSCGSRSNLPLRSICGSSKGTILDLKEDLASLRNNPAYFDADHAEHKIVVEKHNRVVETLSKYGVSAF